MSVWSAHRSSGGDGTGLTVSVRRPEHRLLESVGQRAHEHLKLRKSSWDSNCLLILSTDKAAPTWTGSSKQHYSMLPECISLSLHSRQSNCTDAQTSFSMTTAASRETQQFWLCSPHVSVHEQRETLTTCTSVFWDLVTQHLPRSNTHSPVFKFLAVDAHSSLVALGDTHLVSAALNLLTRVLCGVYICEKIENEMYIVVSSLIHFIPLALLFSAPHSTFPCQSHVPNHSPLFDHKCELVLHCNKFVFCFIDSNVWQQCICENKTSFNRITYASFVISSLGHCKYSFKFM